MTDHQANGSLSKRYQIHEKLGEGSMAEVYRATHLLLGREVALKFIKTDLTEDSELEDIAAKRFLEEARAIARLNHPNILQVYDFDVASDGRFFMATEYLPHGDLLTKLRTYKALNKNLSLSDAVLIVKSVAEGLSYAHVQGVIHRDVKPSNIFLARDERVVIGDFGLAKSLDGGQHDATLTGGFAGTPTYMPPEQIIGKRVDQRADIYSLGIIFFQLLTGFPPYAAGTLTELLAQHLYAPIPDITNARPELPPFAESILQKALAKEPAQRYNTMQAFVNDLRMLENQYVSDEPTIFLHSGPAIPLPPNTHTASLGTYLSGPRLWAAMAVGIAAILLVGLGIWFNSPEEEAPLVIDVTPAAADEYLILISPMYDDETQINLSERIRTQLLAGQMNIVLGGRLRVETLSNPITSDEMALLAGDQANAQQVIWGRETAANWEVVVASPTAPPETLQSLRLGVAKDANFAAKFATDAPTLVDYYARFLFLPQLIAANDLYSVLYIAFAFRELSPEVTSLAMTLRDQQVLQTITHVIQGNYLEADTTSSYLLAALPQDSAIYIWRWAANALAGQPILVERDALRMQEFLNSNDFSRALLTLTYFIYGDTDKLLAIGSTFEENTNSSTELALQEYYQVTIHVGDFQKSLAGVMAQQVEGEPTAFVGTLVLLRAIQGDDEGVQAILPDLLETRQNRVTQEANMFFQALPPHFYHPIVFSQGGYVSQLSDQSLLAELTYKMGLDLWPDDYLINWRQANFEVTKGLYQSAYEHYQVSLANAPVPFPIAAYEQSLLVLEHGENLADPAPACDLLAQAHSLAQSDPEFYSLLLAKIDALLSEHCPT